MPGRDAVRSTDSIRSTMVTRERVPRTGSVMSGSNGTSENGTTQNSAAQGETGETATWTVKAGLAQMLKGGVIMDVVTAEHARIAEEAGACAVMALERVPSDIRAAGGVARMSDPDVILAIMETVSIPVMAKCRIGQDRKSVV